jgi:hypothetical protein
VQLALPSMGATVGRDKLVQTAKLTADALSALAASLRCVTEGTGANDLDIAIATLRCANFFIGYTIVYTVILSNTIITLEKKKNPVHV